MPAHFVRLLRASLRDWSVLLREFGFALVLFLLLSLSVATLFRTFYTHPSITRPLGFDEALYVVLALTVAESALPIPQGAGHWLIVFYFLMPLVGIVLAGQGLANFLALLFNRRARGAAWLDAIAGTYNRHIVVCGLGHVGSRVVESLLAAGSEVVGVEQAANRNSVARVRALGVTVIEGDIRERDVLRRAGLARARAAVICSDNDLANLEAALNCRELNPGVRLVLRLFDADLARRVKDVLAIDEAYSASALAAPIFAGAALEVHVERTFSVGDDVLSVGRVTVQAGSFLDGQTVGGIEERFDCNVIAHERDGHKDIHPTDRVQLAPGDCILVLSDLPTLSRLTAGKRTRGAR